MVAKENRCKTCKSWLKLEPEYGACLHPALSVPHGECCKPTEAQCDSGEIRTGCDFGCVHHEEAA